jgi:hypothetical protein
MQRAEAGAELARQAGLEAEAHADVDSPTWQGSSRSRRDSTPP